MALEFARWTYCCTVPFSTPMLCVRALLLTFVAFAHTLAWSASDQLADVAAGRLSPAGLTWRRRLGYLGMGAAVWRGGVLHEHREAAALVVLYLGVVWVALVTGGRALSRAIASATGEDKPE